ncbi:GAF domain-containing protein [Streptomyces chrestomyceticus]|uniref:GAF domain-containing protein n=1 Tax=Streptomyces chrestomyceticus TaxID=68185 RepID=UPI0034001599
MTRPAPSPQHETAPRQPDPDAVLNALGLTGPDPQLDAFAQRLALAADVPYAMVNIFGAEQQHFLGLCTPGPDSGLPVVGRSMALEHGYCPEVVQREKALVLPDVFVHPRFAGNEVVDRINIRTYAGAPLIYRGVVLGTVCFVGHQEKPKATGRDSLALIKAGSDEVMGYLCRRSGLTPR